MSTRDVNDVSVEFVNSHSTGSDIVDGRAVRWKVIGNATIYELVGDMAAEVRLPPAIRHQVLDIERQAFL
eukprot:7249931-Pyramimonas_sp.AAC.1